MSNVQCGQCGKSYKLTEQIAGKRVRCKSCGHAFDAPSLGHDSLDDLSGFGSDDPFGDFSEADFGNLGDPLGVGGAPGPGNVTSQELPQQSSPLATGSSARSQLDAAVSSGSLRGTWGQGSQFEVCGHEMQYCAISLAPGDSVVAESGAMMYMTSGIEMLTTMGDPSAQGKGMLGKVTAAGKRMMTGESAFVTTFTNGTGTTQDVAFGAPYPGKITPVRLNQVGGQLICQKGAFLCGTAGLQVGIAFQRKIGVGLFGGEGFVMQKIIGNGMAMVHAGGTMMHRTLSPGEQLKVDTGCLMALGPTVQYEIEMVKGIKNKFFGGEGWVLARLTGPGPVWVQSLPFARLAGNMLGGEASGKGEGSLVRKIGGIGSALADITMGD